jgi:uncharacterized protein YbcV (DUF1398 family)
MNACAMDVMRECTKGSDEERLTFPQVVTKLMEAGVERYHADLRRAEKTYYMPDGDSHVIASAPVGAAFAPAFSPDGVAAAIEAIQTGQIGYRAFCERIAAAGCVGYLVSLAGRRAVYFGRTGESHVEPFPAPP